MFTDKDLRELTEFTATDPVLSIYLNTDPTTSNADAYRLRLRNMLKEVDLPDDLQAVERYFTLEYDWSGRGVAVFSCAPKGFFRAYPLAIPVRNLIHVGNRPSVRLLADLLDCYGGYGVVLVDKQGARLFKFHLGELQEQEGIMGEEIRRVKHGMASSMPGARSGAGGSSGRHAEELVERNMKEIVSFAVSFLEHHHIRRVLLGGTEENITMFRSLLPKSWQSLVMGTFPMSMTASHGEVLQKVLEIGDVSDGSREKRLASELISKAASSDGAVVGVEPVLQAVNDGRISTLVMTEAFSHPAFQCANCGRLTVLPGQTCTACGGKYHELTEVRDTLITSVMRSGGDVAVIAPVPSLDLSGNIGAYLRY